MSMPTKWSAVPALVAVELVKRQSTGGNGAGTTDSNTTNDDDACGVNPVGQLGLRVSRALT